MSEVIAHVADVQNWAAHGSRHDWIVNQAKRAFPSAAGALAGLMLILPLTHNREMSFILSKDKVAIAKQRLNITNADYRGHDEFGRPFSLTAASVIQTSSRDPFVALHNLTAQIGQAGDATVVHANSGRYNLAGETVNFDGPIKVNSADGYDLAARGVSLDLKSRQLVSNQGVGGHMPLGDFSAGQMHADVGTHQVALDGRVHLHIVQGGLRTVNK